MDTKAATKNIRLAAWANIVKDRSESGLSVDEYCNKTGITKNMYYYRLRQVRESAIEALPHKFAELVIPERNEIVSDYLEQKGFYEQAVLQIKDIRISVSEATPKSLLEMVVEVAHNA